MLKAEDVDAVVVTRGDVPIYDLLRTLAGFKQVIVWDNSNNLDMGPFGQFLAATTLASSEFVYFQDDDCITVPEMVVGMWTPEKIVCNMGQEGHAKNYEGRLDKLMGFGSCFRRSLIIPTFDRYWSKFAIDRITWREPGRIFTAMNHDKTKVVEVPFKNLPWATGSNRLYKQADHAAMGEEAIRRVKEVLGWGR